MIVKANYLGRVTLKIVKGDPVPTIVEKLDRVTVRSNGSIEWSAMSPDKVMTGSGLSLSKNAGDAIEVTITIKRKE